MRLTTKGRFAVTAMVDLAMRQNRGPVTLAAISERQHISLSYLEQLFGKLRRAKLVSSVRGPGGGYNLAQPGPRTLDTSEARRSLPKSCSRYESEMCWRSLIAASVTGPRFWRSARSTIAVTANRPFVVSLMVSNTRLR